MEQTDECTSKNTKDGGFSETRGSGLRAFLNCKKDASEFTLGLCKQVRGTRESKTVLVLTTATKTT